MSSEDVRLDGATASAGDPPPDEHLVTLLRKTLAENKRLREALERMVSWGDVEGPGALERQTMTMTLLIDIARNALNPETQP